MISNATNSLLRGVNQEPLQKSKEQEKPLQTIVKQGDTSRIDELKASIENGEYRVNIDALAKRIAQELM